MMDRAESVSEERLGFLFQPDVVIPAQYFDVLRSKNAMEPEKRLMLAVLEDAVRSFQDNIAAESEAKKKLFAEAEAWFLEQDADWVFSFENICEALGLTPQYVRRGLLRWKEKVSNRPRPAWEPATLAG